MENESRFEGGGMDFHAKFLGSVKVEKAKGQEVCQEAMQKLLQELRGRKEPKQRLTINLSFEGTSLKEMPPGVNLLDILMKHTEVSFVWKDPRDQRSLGIIRCEAEESGKDSLAYVFYGIRTIKPAMPFLQEMQQLFQIVKNRSEQSKIAKAEEEKQEESQSSKDAGKEEKEADKGTKEGEDVEGTIKEADTTDEMNSGERERAVSNLLKMDREMPKSDSAASLDELSDIFSSSAIAPANQADSARANPFGDSAPFGQPTAQSIPFGQPVGHNSPFGQPTAQNIPFGQPTAQNIPFGQPAGQNIPFGQPLGQNGPFGQPAGQNIPFRQPAGQSNPFGQNNFYGQSDPFGQPHSQNNQFSQPANQFGQTAFSSNEQWQQHQGGSNPFESGFGGLFERQNSMQSDTMLQPESLTPKAATRDPAQPDAFSDLVAGLKLDPRKQQVSSKELFKNDKPKTTLRELANQSPRPQ